MDETSSPISATDLLDSYLDKQLNGISNNLLSNLSSQTSFQSESISTDVSKRHNDVDRYAMDVSRRDGNQMAKAETKKKIDGLIEVHASPIDEFRDLKNRCRMLHRDLSPCNRLEYESEELLRKLEILKSMCQNVISWKPGFDPDQPKESPSHEDVQYRPIEQRLDRWRRIKHDWEVQKPILNLEKYQTLSQSRTPSFTSSSERSTSIFQSHSRSTSSVSSALSAKDIRERYPYLFS